MTRARSRLGRLLYACACGAQASAAFVAAWAPVWIPLGLLAQIGLLGLRPALEERERLLREEPVVEARQLRTRERYERMRAEVEAWSDPVWRERWARAVRARSARQQ